MSKIQYQFYTFNEEHFAVPLSTFSGKTDKKQSWATVTAHIEVVLGCTPSTGSAHEHSCIIVLLADMKDLHEEQTYRNLTIPLPETQIAIRHIKEGGKDLQNPDKFDENQLRKARPILMVAAEDIMGLFAEASGENIQESPWRYQYRLDLDARVKFWDSGIWHQYVPIEGHQDTDTEHFGKRFKETFNRMAQWYKDGLYATFVALENLEFQTRLMQHSFIADIGHHGHETRVTPFKFHSETVIARMSADIIEELTPKLIREFKWRLLLVDDYAEEPISSLDKVCTITKSKLIKQVLQENFDEGFDAFEIKSPIQADGTIAKSEIIEHSLTMLKQGTYDIILLDYLLGEGKKERTGREYGYDFLRELIDHMTDDKKKKKKKIHKGPLGRFWIFSISSFPFAFADKLRQLGMDGYSDHWYLSGGGDPICTPELFRYNFLNFIKQQISECYLHTNALENFFNRFSSIENGILWRNLVLNAITSIHLNKSVLENDEAHGSLFARTMLSFIRNNRDYKTTLDQIRSFVANIMQIPYFRIKDALTNPEGKETINTEALMQKSALFFQAEKKLETKIKKCSKHRDRDTFDFDGKRLRWLPATIKELTNLRVLRLGNNQLSTLPSELAQLSQLKQLDLSYNQLEALPNNLKDLATLEYLDLTGNPDLPEYLRTKHEGKSEIQELFTNTAVWNRDRRKKVVVSYANVDSKEFLELEKILKPLVRSGDIAFWADTRILPGDQWDPAIQKHFQQADIILFLVSADFLASDYIYNVEMNIAMERHSKKECQIIPIILKECDWQHEPLKKFQALPKGIRPVYSQYRSSPDEAWKEVSEGIRKVLTDGRLT